MSAYIFQIFWKRLNVTGLQTQVVFIRNIVGVYAQLIKEIDPGAGAFYYRV